MSARIPRRWWIPITMAVTAGNANQLIFRKGRNVSIEGFGGGTSADIDLHCYVIGHGVDGIDRYILPNQTELTPLDTAARVPILADYFRYRSEMITDPIEVCDIEYLIVYANNNGISDTYFVGHLRGESWG